MKNKALAILLSAVVAFGLWFYVITQVSTQTEKVFYEIPVVFQNENILTERGMMIVGEKPTVTLALKSDRKIINALSETNINVITNVANIDKVGTHNLTYSISYPGNIPYNEVSVQSSSTDLITLQIENRIRKMVPVIIDYGNTSVQDGYIADLSNAQANPAAIEISGPEPVMNQIDRAVIKADLTGRTQTLVGSYQYALCNSDGTPVNAEYVSVHTKTPVSGEVELTVNIQRVKEIALKLNVINGGGAVEGQNTTVTMDNTKLQISGSDALLNGLDELVVGTVNLGEMVENQTLTFPITLPDGVTNRTGVDQVTVEVKFNQLMVQTFNVRTITAVNVPAGLRGEIITKALTVTVRGPVDMVKKMSAADIAIEVDFSEAQTGTATMKAQVVIDEAFPDVGAVGTYQVSAKLRD